MPFSVTSQPPSLVVSVPKSGRIMSSPQLLPPTGSLPANIDWAVVAFWLAYFGIYLNVVLLLVQ